MIYSNDFNKVLNLSNKNSKLNFTKINMFINNFF